MTTTPLTGMVRALYDVPLIAHMHQLSNRADPAGPAQWLRVAPDDAPCPRRLGILAGAFNPPTVAHLALADEAMRVGGLDEVAITISKMTVDKENAVRVPRCQTACLCSLPSPAVSMCQLRRQALGPSSAPLWSTVDSMSISSGCARRVATPGGTLLHRRL